MGYAAKRSRSGASINGEAVERFRVTSRSLWRDAAAGLRCVFVAEEQEEYMERSKKFRAEYAAVVSAAVKLVRATGITTQEVISKCVDQAADGFGFADDVMRAAKMRVARQLQAQGLHRIAS